MEELRPGRDSDQFNVRFPPGMRERIKAAADRNGRSMNAEIIATLAVQYPPIQLEVKAIDGVMHYIQDAAPKDRPARIVEVNRRFEDMGSLLRIEERPDGTLAITTET